MTNGKKARRARVEIDGVDVSGAVDSVEVTGPEVDIVGQMHYPGDVRRAEVMIYSSPRFGRVFPQAAEYDEEADRSTVHFAGIVPPKEIEAVQPFPRPDGLS